MAVSINEVIEQTLRRIIENPNIEEKAKDAVEDLITKHKDHVLKLAKDLGKEYAIDFFRKLLRAVFKKDELQAYRLIYRTSDKRSRLYQQKLTTSKSKSIAVRQVELFTEQEEILDDIKDAILSLKAAVAAAVISVILGYATSALKGLKDA